MIEELPKAVVEAILAAWQADEITVTIETPVDKIVFKKERK